MTPATTLYLVIGALAVLCAVLAVLLVTRRVPGARRPAARGAPSARDLVGARAVVVAAIPAGGYGQVRVRVEGHPLKLPARAARPIALGASVLVTQALSDTNVVVSQE